MQQIDEQPWVPAGLAAKLVVGARVRVNLRPHCPYYRLEGDVRPDDVTHSPYTQGMTGTIRFTDCAHDESRDHAYFVRYDNITPGGFDQGHFAAIELIVLEDAP